MFDNQTINKTFDRYFDDFSFEERFSTFIARMNNAFRVRSFKKNNVYVRRLTNDKKDKQNIGLLDWIVLASGLLKQSIIKKNLYFRERKIFSLTT